MWPHSLAKKDTNSQKVGQCEQDSESLTQTLSEEEGQMSTPPGPQATGPRLDALGVTPILRLPLVVS